MPNVTGMALLLPGWGRYSVWGWDPTGGHLFARLWRNNDRPDMPPAIRVGPVNPYKGGIGSPGTVRVEDMAELIARATGTDVRAVLLAMAAGAPQALQNQLRNRAPAH